VKAILVSFGIDRYRGDSKLHAGADYPKRYLAAVGYEDFVKHETTPQPPP